MRSRLHPARLSLWLQALLTLTAGRALGFSAGPPNGFTAAPGDNLLACAECHAHFNSGDGSAALLGPSAYVAGDTLDFTVALQKVGQRRWGFEATALNATHQAAGTIVVTDAVRTQVDTATNGRQYIKHTLVGTDAFVPDLAPGWSFRWIAPPPGTGTVTFYLAGNAADNDGSRGGDFIYTTTLRLAEAQTAILSRTWSGIKSLYRSTP
jgi:hypothetical protein